MTVRQSLIFGEVADERRRQVSKWGAEHQTHPHKRVDDAVTYWQYASNITKRANDRLSMEEITWQDILWEEVTEVFAEEEWLKRRAELVQVMAVCCAEIEDGDIKREKDLRALKEVGVITEAERVALTGVSNTEENERRVSLRALEECGVISQAERKTLEDQDEREASMRRHPSGRDALQPLGYTGDGTSIFEQMGGTITGPVCHPGDSEQNPVGSSTL